MMIVIGLFYMLKKNVCGIYKSLVCNKTILLHTSLRLCKMITLFKVKYYYFILTQIRYVIIIQYQILKIIVVDK